MASVTSTSYTVTFKSLGSRGILLVLSVSRHKMISKERSLPIVSNFIISPLILSHVMFANPS